MITLKNTWQGIPGGFLFTQPECGWESVVQVPQSQWDFKLLCRSIYDVRKANPRFNLNTDMNAIEQEAKQQNAMRMLSIAGGEYYIQEDSAPSRVSPKVLRSLRKGGASAVVAARNLISGTGTIMEMFGPDGPGDKATAERRACVCVGISEQRNEQGERIDKCKWNDTGDWTRFFTEAASNVIRSRLGIVKDLDLTTSKDAELQTCTLCSCPLRLKLFARIQHIIAHMPEAVRKDFAENAPWCWINSETK